jgi:hypothetical protein
MAGTYEMVVSDSMKSLVDASNQFVAKSPSTYSRFPNFKKTDISALQAEAAKRKIVIETDGTFTYTSPTVVQRGKCYKRANKLVVEIEPDGKREYMLINDREHTLTTKMEGLTYVFKKK